MAKSAHTASVIAPKGTPKTEVIMGTAASKLAAGMKALNETVIELGTMTEKIEENALIIANQEAEIASKEQELKNKIAQDKIELQQAYDSNRKTFVEQWLREKNFIMMDQLALTKLEQELLAAQDGNEEEKKKEIAIITNSMKSAHANELKTKELEFKATQAESNAKLTQMAEKIKFMEEQVASYRKQLDEEREARVKVAQASTIQQTFTGSGK